jgi:2-oxoglutarate ferredoxin oxidoreductase subunit beta
MLIAKMAPPMPVAMGVIFRVQRPTYEQQVHAQIAEAQTRKGAGDLNRILQEGNTWTVE